MVDATVFQHQSYQVFFKSIASAQLNILSVHVVRGTRNGHKMSMEGLNTLVSDSTAVMDNLA